MYLDITEITKAIDKKRSRQVAVLPSYLPFVDSFPPESLQQVSHFQLWQQVYPSAEPQVLLLQIV